LPIWICKNKKEDNGHCEKVISAGKFKTEGAPFQPLSPQARANMQRMVDDFHAMFINAVARNRGVATSTVKNGFGEDRMVLAQDAVKARDVGRCGHARSDSGATRRAPHEQKLICCRTGNDS
jgi:ClpP class serine protease